MRRSTRTPEGSFARRGLFLSLLAALASALTAVTWAAGASGVGVVLLHGKQDEPPYAVQPLAAALRAAGHLVETPEMPWSLRRDFDAAHEEALAEIAEVANGLRRRGARRIVVGGHGLGGNTALAFAASGAQVDGLLLVAPAHVPESPDFARPVAADVNRARELVAAGNGAGRALFHDTNHRSWRPVSTTAAIYWSYYNPDGTAAMSRSARGLRHPLPVLWVYGSRDVLRIEGGALFFDLLPPHPLSRRESLWTPFGGTPRAAADVALEWLKLIER